MKQKQFSYKSIVGSPSELLFRIRTLQNNSIPDPGQRCFLSPLATQVAGIPPVPAVDPQDVRLHVRVAGEELQADAAGVLVVGKGGGLKVGVLVVLLILVGLQHHLQGGIQI